VGTPKYWVRFVLVTAALGIVMNLFNLPQRVAAENPYGQTLCLAVTLLVVSFVADLVTDQTKGQFFFRLFTSTISVIGTVSLLAFLPGGWAIIFGTAFGLLLHDGVILASRKDVEEHQMLAAAQPA